MKSDGAEAGWLPVADAFATHCQQLGLPEEITAQLIAQSLPDRHGMMWLSDRPVMVHESPYGLAFDRKDFDEL